MTAEGHLLFSIACAVFAKNASTGVSSAFLANTAQAI
ncbi:hypothetical protein ACUOCP_20065, partial [Escherichia sp. R-CC3]